MKNTFATEFFGDMPPWAKGVVGIVVVGGLALAGYKVYGMVKSKIDEGEANAAAKEADKELRQLGINPSYSQTQYVSFVSTLVEAMNDCGTNEEKIFNVFRAMNNKADVLKLISAFGVRYYQPCPGDQPISYTLSLFNDKRYGGNLPTWLAYDLTSGEIKKINDILSKKGINFKF